MNRYSKLMLAASLGLTTNALSAAEVISYFNNHAALNEYNASVGKQASKQLGAEKRSAPLAKQTTAQIAQHFAHKAAGQLNLISSSKQAEQQFLRYQQTWQGLTVWDHQLVVMLDNQGQIKQGYGALANAINKDLPAIPEVNRTKEQQQLESFIKQGFSDQSRVFSDKSTEMVIYLDKTDTARLVYKFEFFTDVTKGKSQPQKILAFVDVNSGEILAQNDVLHRAKTIGGSGPSGNAKVTRAPYQQSGLDNNPPTTFSVKNRPFYDTCSFNVDGIDTRDYNHDVNAVGSAFEYGCADNGDAYNDHETYNTAQSALNDAHYHGQVTSLMYQDYLGQTPFPGKTIIQNVHYGVDLDQAFYNNGQVSYGDGYWVFYPMVALDVVSHEIAHGFTEEYGTSSKKYMITGQALAINEAFSDISGAAAEYYLYNNNEGWSDDWLSNAESYQAPDKALRYFEDPTEDGVSIGHIRDYESTTPAHYASGLFNKAFHRLVTSEVSETETSPWNTKYAFILFAHANQNCWISTSTFTQAADCVFNQAATLATRLSDDGVTKLDSSSVWTADELKNHIRKAFAQVGIDLAVDVGIESEFSYSSKFSDFNFSAASRFDGNAIPASSENWTWVWDFGDGNTSNEANPSHSYTTADDYVVSLQTLSTDPNGPSDTFTLPVTASDGYCSVNGGNFDRYYIESVTINGSPKTTGGTAWSDFSTTAIDVIDGVEFDVQIAAGQPASTSGKNKNFYLWIDLNNDGLFHKTNELVLNGLAKDQVSATLSVSGETGELLRARALVSFSILDEACGSFSFGEAEDYTLKIGSNSVPPTLAVEAIPGTNQITFDNTTIDSRIKSWSWTFGDGGSSTEASPSHPYAESGNYNVTLNALDAEDVSLASWQQSVTVITTTQPKMDAPFIDGLSVTFDASISDMPVGSVISWDFDDNTPTGSTAVIEHTYGAAADYFVTLTITNADNPQGVAMTTTVTVTDSSYQAAFGYSVSNDLDVTFNNNSATPGDLSGSSPNATLIWDFDDGSPVETVTSADFGQDIDHSYDGAGSYSPTLTIEYTNDSGQLVTTVAATQTFDLTEPPVSVNYCPGVGYTEFEFINKVSFDGVEWSNGDAGGMVNDGNPVEFTAGATINYTIHTGTTEASDYEFYEENYHIWIDMDGDGVFGGVNDWQDDLTERVVTGFANYGESSISGSFTLPAGDFATGSTHTRMRILQYYSFSQTNAVNPCSNYFNSGDGGEIEDYEITVIKN